MRAFARSLVMDIREIEEEIALLSERVSELRSLQRRQQHLAFMATHLEDHIIKLQQRIATLRRQVDPD
ncbi:MAG: hypothetical protein ACXVZV_05720 [Terriglobales bacterium]